MMGHASHLAVAAVLAMNWAAAAQDAPAEKARIYVPYQDLAAVMEPAGKAVLMDRAAFARLLAAAAANTRRDSIELGQVTSAQYAAVVTGERLSLSGELVVATLSDLPVAVPLQFAQVSLTRVLLDDKPAPLGYDSSARLVMIVTGRGPHKVALWGALGLKELSGGGMQFGISLPPTVAGTMKLTAPGDLTIHATVPASTPVYDKQADQTTVFLTLGAQEAMTVALIGNGRQEDQRAILLGESVTSVELNPSYQVMSCLYTVQVLARGVRELQFALERGWTISEVDCPNLVKWSVEAPPGAAAPQVLTVRLRSASRGTQALHICSSAALRAGETAWRAPHVRLMGAAFQRGYLLVDGGEEFRARGEKLVDARHEDKSAAASVPGISAAVGGQLYYHWGDRWAVGLDFAAVTLRRASEDRQTLTITPKQLRLDGRFQVAAIGRELFDMSFVLPADKLRWDLWSVTVDARTDGFEYRVAEVNGRRVLTIELARPLRSEAAALVGVSLLSTPSWDLSAAREHEVSVAAIQPQADTVSGLLAISSQGDLDAVVLKAPPALKEVSVGRMAALGLPPRVQTAYTYEAPVEGEIQLRIHRRQERLSAQSVGLVTVTPKKLLGDWAINYDIQQARTDTLYLLADKSLGQEILIDVPGRRLASRRILAGAQAPKAGAGAMSVPPGYDLWQLTLDSEAGGGVAVQVHYDRPLPGKDFKAPLVRPCAAQTSELLAIQASEDLAVAVDSEAAADVDAVDLPPLPAAARRLLAALRLEGPATPKGAAASVTLKTTVHKNYTVPPALAGSARLTTYLGADGSQRTAATFQVANAGLQFLSLALPEGAQLWSAGVAGRQAKPKRRPDGLYLLSMPRSHEGVEVRVVYQWTPPKHDVDNVAMGCATLPGVRINSLQWDVVAPPGYRITSQKTHMQTENLQPPSPAYLEMLHALDFTAFKAMQGRALSEKALFAGYEGGGEAPAASDDVRSAPRVTLYNGQRVFVPSTKPRAEGRERETARDLEKETESNAELQLRYPRDWKEITARREAIEAAKKGLTEAFKPTAGAPSAEATYALVPATQPAGPGAEPKPLVVDGGFIIAGGLVIDRSGSMVDRWGSLVTAGRYTLPVELTPTPGAPPAVTFTALGQADLVIALTRESQAPTWAAVGFAFIAIWGFALVKGPAKDKTKVVILVLVATTLLAVWWPATTGFANGAFAAGVCLIPFYLVIGVTRWIVRKIRAPWVVAAAAMLIAALAWTAGPLQAADPLGAGPPPAQPSAQPPAQPSAQPPPAGEPSPAPVSAVPAAAPVVIPYDGDASKADQSDKVLVPYARFVELWNLAHPDEPLELPTPPAGVSLAAVKYAAAVGEERMELVLTADVRTYGKGFVTLPMPIAGAAVTEATLDGKPARLQVGEKGMILTLEAGISGTLRIAALTTPKYLGRRGSVGLSLPPLPAAVMTVLLAQEDLVLEAPGLDAAPTSRKVANGVEWTLGLGGRSQVSLRWGPKAGGGAADRTLAAAADHNVYVFHWAMVGLSRFTFTFSAADYDRFAILLPAGVTLTDLSGANLRDHRVVGEQAVEGQAFKVVEARLLRPAAKRYELTARWMADLPAPETPAALALPRAGDVAREGGTVTLHAAGGMSVKVPRVTGGRKSEAATTAAALAGTTEAVGQYYWPYRPFSLTIQLSRQEALASARIDQLVRVDTRRVELLAQAHLEARGGMLFGGSFALPDGYELLSVVGPAVGDFYVQPTPTGRQLHVNFRGGVTRTRLSLVLFRGDPRLESLDVPAVVALGRDSQPLPGQKGRLAVQLAASLAAHTAASENLKPIVPRAAADWLEPPQVQAVQFAYEYERPKISLTLNVRRQETKARVEVFAGLTLGPSEAAYAYRLRYTIEGSPIDHVRFSMPKRYASLVTVASPAMRSVTAADDKDTTQWNLSLINEVTGVLDVTVNFSLSIDADTASLEVPRITTDAPAGYRAILAVQNFSRHELSVASSANLTALSVGEQGRLLSPMVRESLQYVFESFSRDWSLALALTPAKAASRVQAVVDLLALATTIDRNGQCRYEARLSLQNRSEQFLRLKVPKGLALWSAEVAGEPVRPVLAANAAAGEILIPLVKTSPGGLPYDVRLYLANATGRGLVSKLNAITRIEPPPISIVGIPVVRTTWSLRLPAGYSYVRPGGNVSPVAGTAEMMSIAIDARLDQIKRLAKTYSEGVTSERGKQIATRNWAAFNAKVSGEIQDAYRYNEANPDQMSQAEYNRVKLKLGGQGQSQYELEGVWARAQQAEQKRSEGNLTVFLNGDARNGGTSEDARNQPLMTIPVFVQKAAQEQQKEISSELQAGEQQQAAKLAPPQPSRPQGQPGQQAPQAQPPAQQEAQVLLGHEDKNLEVQKLLKNLEEGQKRQVTLHQRQLVSQQKELVDNRLTRYYKQGSGSLAQGRMGLGEKPAPPEKLLTGTDTYNTEVPLPRTTPGAGGGGTSGRARGGEGVVPGDTNGDRIRDMGDLTVRVPSFKGPHIDISGVAQQAGQPVTAGGGWGGGVYVAEGTFSLSVPLPEGQVRQDFAHPSGDARVSLWAVRTDLIQAMFTTGGILAVLALLYLAVRLRRYFFRPVRKPAA